MRRGMLIGLVAVLVPGALAGQAAAAPQLVTRAGAIELGPELAGERVFLGAIRRPEMDLLIAGPGQAPRKLDTVAIPGSRSDDDESPGEYESYRSAIAASADRLGFVQARSAGNARYQQGINSLVHTGGPPAGELATLGQCSNDYIYGPAAATVDVDGTRSAVTDCDGRIVIREGSEVVATLSAEGQAQAVGTVALAGRYVAYDAYGIPPMGATPNTTVVRDWMTGATLYEAPRAAGFDLQSDGTLVTARGGGEDCTQGTLAWQSIAEPQAHALPFAPCSADVNIAGNRVAAALADANGERTLALIGLDGTRADVARLGRAGIAAGAQDYDGERVAYALRNCLGGVDLLTEETAAPQLRDEPRSCPVGLPTRRNAMGPKDRHALVQVDCPRGCRGTLMLRARIGKELRTIGTRTVRIAPDTVCDDPQRVRITRAALAQMRRRGHLDARQVVFSTDRAGNFREIGRPLRLRAASRSRGVEVVDCAPS